MTHTLIVHDFSSCDPAGFTLVPDALLEGVAGLLKEYGGCETGDWPAELRAALDPVLGDEPPAGVVDLGDGFCELPPGCTISRVFSIFVD